MLLGRVSQKGQTIIEVVVAFGTAIVVLVAVTIAVLYALNNAQFSKNQKLAADYSLEGIEVVRHTRDIDYSVFSTLGGDYCLGKGVTKIDKNLILTPRPHPTNGCGQNYDIFVREAKIEQNETSDCGSSALYNIAKVTVKTSWNDGKCRSTNNLFCHSSVLSSCLSDANQLIPTP